jgi:hypothetical protein
LQRLIRTSPGFADSKIKPLVVGRAMHRNFEVSLSNSECSHSESCGCVVTVIGKSPRLEGLKVESSVGSTTDRFRDCAVQIEMWLQGAEVGHGLEVKSEIEYFKASIPRNGTVTILPTPPGETTPHFPDSGHLFSVSRIVERSLKHTDYRYFKAKYPHMSISWNFLEYEVWHGTSEVPSLLALCLRKQSAYHWCLGRTNGRPHVYACMANLYPRKFADACSSIARQRINGEQIEPMKYAQEAIDHMYRLMKVDLSKPVHVPFSLRPLTNMYLGASAGRSGNVSYSLKPDANMPTEVKVSSSGKKIEHFEQYLTEVIEYLRTGKEPNIEWTLPPKNENGFTFTKQNDDQAWAAVERKLRVFNIPSGIYIILERLVSQFRHLKERGWAIRIGHKWSHGGADTIARCLGVDLLNAFIASLVEGDIEKFDQGAIEDIINLFFSTMHIHQMDSEDKQIFEKITKFLLRVMLNRVTRLFADIWGVVRGGVPSGAYNTSHLDSWIMLFYFCIFCVFTIMSEPDLEKREKLELEFIAILKIVVYGDDHLYNKGTGLGAHYFSGTAFAAFLKRYFNVVLRDLKDGVPFCSKVSNGWVIFWGATFLKHQFIENPDKSPGQPVFLPFRESREFLIRAIWGRETRSRDEIDVLLSILGHAYGTYASNRDAYDRLHILYSEIVSSIGIENLQSRLLERIAVEDLKKIRQLGMTPQELVSGFPSWDVLVQKNVYDSTYQDTTYSSYDYLSEYESQSEFEFS